MTMINYVEQVATPAEALMKLKEGNFRFINNLTVNKDLLVMVDETKDVQKPYAAILSCMDSRTSAELIFDQGVGDIFSLRIAGNVVTDGILGSLEYATAVVGSKLILVLGHTNCGAIKGACDGVEMGHLTSLLHQIKPAIEAEKTVSAERNSHNTTFVNAVTKLNVEHSVQQIMDRSPIIRDLVKSGAVGIGRAIYNVSTGKITFDDTLVTG